MSFPIQKKLPKKGNKYYNTTGVGGYSHCIVGKPTQTGLNVLDNCVGWACGRFNEVYSYLSGYKGMKYYQIHCDAEKFINRAKAIGLKTRKEPITGGIMVWQKGSTLHHKDGAGHVAFVEQRKSKTNVYTSESGYNSFAFANKTRTKGNGNWGTGKGYKYLGCIIDPAMTKDSIDLTEELQQSLNKQWKCGLKEDGVWGKATENACKKHQLHLCIKAPTMVKWLQNRLVKLGYSVKIDGSFGYDTQAKIKQFQKDKRLKVDGVVGVQTYKALVE